MMHSGFDPASETNRARLRSALDWSFQRLAIFRENRLLAIKELVGAHYSENGSFVKKPVNELRKGLRIYMRLLAARAPAALITTETLALKSGAVDFSIALNHLTREINLRASLRTALQETLIGGIGVLKVARNPHLVEMDGYLHDVGQPYASPVTLDDLILDMSAANMEQIGFIGNKYRIPLEWAQQCEFFDPVERAKLTAERSHSGGEERAEEIGKAAAWQEEYVPRCELVDLWLPHENLILTLPAEGNIPLTVRPWVGREKGPYHVLIFEEVPSNLIGLSLTSDWMDLHYAANQTLNKLVRQAENQKTNLFYRRSAAEDMERQAEAADGDPLASDDPGGIKGASSGGIDQGNMAFLIWLLDRFSIQGGNLQSLGGLGPQSDTVGQDELIATAGAKQLEDMQAAMTEFAGGVLEGLGWYLWHDPLIEKHMIKELAPGVPVETWFRPEMREGDFMDYNIKVRPYSMQHTSPGQRLKTIMTLVQQILVPGAQAMQAEGLALDFTGLLKLFAEYSDMDELEELVTSAMPLAQPIQVSEGGGGMPANTTRNYVRTSRVGATQQGKDRALMTSMLGVQQQPEEANATFK